MGVPLSIPLEFIQQNAMLIMLAAVSGGMLVFTSFRRDGGKGVSPTQATLLINREDAQVLDVREPGEFAGGHLQGAKNIPLARLAENAAQLEKFKGKPVLVCCASGMRSAKAVGELEKLGLDRVFNLEGGVQAWAGAGLPLAGKGRK